jgi:hypothetical protein
MNDSIIISIIGVSGAVIGSIATLSGNFLIHWLKIRDESLKEKPAKDLLIEMLNNKNTWRNLDTLAHVIGADQEKAKRLLLEIGARASEDGKNLWALKSRAPLDIK